MKYSGTGKSNDGVERGIDCDAGMATIEFIFVVLALLVPIVLGLVALDRLQSAMFATQNVATQILRAHTHQRVVDPGDYQQILPIVMRSHGLEAVTKDLGTEISCTPDCQAPGAHVNVRVQLDVVMVDLPFVGQEFTGIQVRAQSQGVRWRYLEGS